MQLRDQYQSVPVRYAVLVAGPTAFYGPVQSTFPRQLSQSTNTHRLRPRRAVGSVEVDTRKHFRGDSVTNRCEGNLRRVLLALLYTGINFCTSIIIIIIIITNTNLQTIDCTHHQPLLFFFLPHQPMRQTQPICLSDGCPKHCRLSKDALFSRQ